VPRGRSRERSSLVMTRRLWHLEPLDPEGEANLNSYQTTYRSSKLPTSLVVGFPLQGVSAHTSPAVTGGLHDDRSVTRRGFLRGVPTRGHRPKSSHTPLVIGGLPSLQWRVMRRERRGVIRPRFKGLPTKAPPRSTRLADRECTHRCDVVQINSYGGETGRPSNVAGVGPVGFLPRLQPWASSSNLCEQRPQRILKTSI